MKPFPLAGAMLNVLFAISVVSILGGALLAVLTTRIIRSVCGLAVCCCGLAGVYYFLHSPFLTLMEILVYVGAICVTIIFAVMLAEPDEAPSGEKRGAAFGWGACALLVSGIVFWAISHLGLNHAWVIPANQVNTGSIKNIGTSLLTTYTFAFELISLVLLIAVLGALVVARQGRSKP